MQETIQNQPQPVPEPKPETKVEPSKPEYRDLSEDEQELLFTLYDKHGGNLSALSRDEESIFHSRPQLFHYEKKYGWEDKLVQVRTDRAKEVIGKLGEAKIRAIQRAMELLETRERSVILKTGAVVNVEMDPMYKEIVAAWEIIKTELGEPTSITKSENKTDVNVVEESVNKLNQFINDVKTAATETAPTDQEDSPPPG